MNRIQLAVPEGNTPSKRVAEKANFSYEGKARGAFFLNGIDIDLHIYSMLRAEWKDLGSIITFLNIDKKPFVAYN
ncbi:MAG: GNAT family N-acetyltransferase [Gammaproteobacteria bacterium]